MADAHQASPQSGDASDRVQDDTLTAEAAEVLAADAGEPTYGADPAAASGDPAASEQPLEGDTFVSPLEAVAAERDSYLVDLQRVTAEFANFRRQAAKRQSDTVQHAASGLAEKLLPVLDACDAALFQGVTDAEPIRAALLDVLTKAGLEVLTEAGEPFDPERHEAVIHESSAEAAEPLVAEVMRAGYGWNGRVLRPAMVRVHG